MKRSYILIIAAIIVVAALAAWLIPQWYTSPSERAALEEQQRIREREEQLTSEVLRLTDLSHTTSTASLSAVSGHNALYIKEQEQGAAIVVDSATLENPGFIVIYQAIGKKGEPTFFNASSHLERGAYTLVSIAAPTKLAPANSYIATIYTDTDGSGAFEQGKDTAVTKADGTRMEVIFPIKKTTSR